MTRLLFILALTVMTTTPPAQTNQIIPALDDVTKAAPVDAFRREWYSKHLQAMAEPPLPDGPIETNRFLYLRTFHDPIAVRASCSKLCSVTAVRLDGSGGYEPGSVVERTSHLLTEQNTAKVRELISQTQFWSRQPEEKRLGLDGAQWVLEGQARRNLPPLRRPSQDFRCFETRVRRTAVRDDALRVRKQSSDRTSRKITSCNPNPSE